MRTAYQFNLFFCLFISLQFCYSQTKAVHKELILIGDLGPGSSPVLPLVLFSDSVDLKALRTEIKNDFFRKHVFLESSFKSNKEINRLIDSVVISTINKSGPSKHQVNELLNPVLNYVRYSDGHKNYSVGVYNDSIATNIIKNLIALFKRINGDEKIITKLERIKRESLFCYD